MKIIIVGAGNIGGTLIEYLINEKHDIVVVDNNPTTVDYCVTRFDINGVVGEGCERSTLIQAGVENADIFIATTPLDEHNIICCILAKKLGAKYTVARLHNPKYFDELLSLRDDFDLDLAINPEYRTAQEIAHLLKFPSANRVETFSHGLVSMANFLIKPNNALVGMSLIDVRKNFGQNVIFGLIERENKVFIPRGDFVIKKGDLATIIATEGEISLFFKKIKIFKSQVKNVFIIGGGTISYYLARILNEQGAKVKILEKDNERCNELANILRGVTILHGDATNHEILDEEGLQISDACVTLTGVDEENVIISLYAKQKQVDKIVTKLDRSSITKMVNKIGLDSIVSPKHVIANRIVKFVRSKEQTSQSDLSKLYKIHDEVEAIEFFVTDKFSKLNVKLKDIKLKNDILIGGVVRDNQFILPTGETFLNANDRVLIVTALKGLKDLSQILR